MEILQNNHGQKLLGLSTPPMEVLWQTTFSLQLPHTEYLGPPVIRCLGCDNMLEVHNAPTTVICHTLHGPVLALKITLRCSRCLLNYRYEQYGSERNGYRYYEQPRDYVKASRTTYIMRSLQELFIAAGHHTWCSFEGAAEVYNEMVRLSFSENATNTAKFLSLCPLRVTETLEKNNGEDIDCLPYELNRKLVAEAFWNAESEMELRETKNIGHSFFSVSAREDLMKEIDRKRANTTYPHNDCSDKCKKRGCGTLWSCDGNWKLTYPICMFDTPKELSGFSGQLNYVSACPNQPENGEAFCEEHKEKAKSLGIPTILGDYVKYKKQNSRDIGLAGKKADKQVDLHAASDCQGTTGIIDKFPNMSADLDDEDSSSKPSCNKETGEKKRIQRWTRGHFFVVRGGGHIDTWQPLYQSEGPAQVFLILLVWMISAMQEMSRKDRQEIYLALVSCPAPSLLEEGSGDIQGFFVA
uniref:CxC5 like cysteine cluster associated with KDZ domain-containing protein n=1 Tax=Amphimedon queenslandica TaxID=400682 RepID=A0A1X7UPD7_AMPQE